MMLDQFLADAASAADEIRRIIREHGVHEVPGPAPGDTWTLSGREKLLAALTGSVRRSAARARQAAAPHGPTPLSRIVDAVEDAFVRLAADALYVRQSNEPPDSIGPLMDALGDGLRYAGAAPSTAEGPCEVVLTVHQHEILDELSRRPTATKVIDLAAALGHDRGALSENVNAMIALGLVMRIGRRQGVAITQRGRDLHQRITPTKSPLRPH